MKKSLSRKKDSRNSLIRNLATSLILYEQIKTTKAKASQVKPVVEHLLYVAKKDDLNARRMLLAYLFDKKAVDKVFDIYVKRYKDINSGFIKTYQIGNRLGDNSKLVLLRLQEGEPINVEEIMKENDGKKNNTSKKQVAKK